jgi:hypothetical protein
MRLLRLGRMFRLDEGETTVDIGARRRVGGVARIPLTLPESRVARNIAP